jgi:hypothetical protein
VPDGVWTRRRSAEATRAAGETTRCVHPIHPVRKDVPLGHLTPADRCGAQAFVVTTMETGQELLWCGHHFATNKESLEATRARVTVDSRDTIDAA